MNRRTVAYANPGIFLQALQGAAQQHRMVLTKSLTTFATQKNGQKHATISRYKYILNKVCIYIKIYTYIAIYIFIYLMYVDNDKLINIYKTLQVCKYVCIYIYICVCATSLCVIISYRCMYCIYIYIYVHKLIWINDIGSAKTTRSFRRSLIHKRRSAPVFVPFRWWFVYHLNTCATHNHITSYNVGV